MDAFITRVAASLAAKAVTSLSTQLVDSGRKALLQKLPFIELTRAALAGHLAAVQTWSRTISFFGRDPAAVEGATIELTLTSIARQFRLDGSAAASLVEDDLLTSRTNWLILGDPGAGKTTALKRLALRVQGDGSSSEIPEQAVILQRLRELEPGSRPLLVRIVEDVFGLRVEARPGSKPDSQPEYFVSDLEIATAAAFLLDGSELLLFLDGLDEIPNLLDRRRTLREIEALSSRLRVSRVFLTCRSGEYESVLEGFRLAEILPLASEQVTDVAQLWLGSADRFLEELTRRTYSELASRPLFLGHLLLLFERSGQLPSHPAAVYEHVIRLMLEGWDRQNRVRRISRYAGFEPNEKQEFLAHLAYDLMFNGRTRRFTELQLIEAYQRVCDQFDLPRDEARYVAREIESHTGLVLQSGAEHFEFSHLTLQEFLAAHKLVRQVDIEALIKYFWEAPGVVALAVALSADPDDLLFRLFRWGQLGGGRRSGIGAFLKRLEQEQPRFSGGSKLGLATLALLTFAREDDADGVRGFIVVPRIRESLLGALQGAQLTVGPGRETEVAHRLLSVPSQIPSIAPGVWQLCVRTLGLVVSEGEGNLRVVVRESG